MMLFLLKRARGALRTVSLGCIRRRAEGGGGGGGGVLCGCVLVLKIKFKKFPKT